MTEHKYFAELKRMRDEVIESNDTQALLLFTSALSSSLSLMLGGFQPEESLRVLSAIEKTANALRTIDTNGPPSPDDIEDFKEKVQSIFKK